jgi:hypothetical protein
MQMNKLLLLLVAVCAGVVGSSQMRSTGEPIRMAGEASGQKVESAANEVAKMRGNIAALRIEVSEKKIQLRAAWRHPEISAALLELLESDFARGNAAAWAELRQQLDIGWDSSPDYVLVSKRVLKDLQYARTYAAARPSEISCDILALTAGEKSAIQAALSQGRQAAWLSVERSEPGGDIVAQYTVQTPDAAVQLAVSNNFAAALTDAVGVERAGLLLPGAPGAWSELKSQLWPDETETMTVRQISTDAGTDLVCEIGKGTNVSTQPVRYASYPSFPFLTLFPGGWKTLAQKEGFELPANFQGQ